MQESQNLSIQDSNSGSGLFPNAQNILINGGTFVILDSGQKHSDNLPHSSDRRRKNRQSAPTPAPIQDIKSELRSRGSVETVTDSAPNSPVLSDITADDSSLDSLSPVDRVVHALRTGASLADHERRRCVAEIKWAESQGKNALASQMKREVKHYTALMQTFNREAELKAMEEDREQTASSSGEKGTNQFESQTHPEYGTVIGVDLGTTKSEVDEVMLVGGSTRIPKVQELLKDYFDREPFLDFNPVEAVAIDATIQPAILSGQVSGITVLNVTSCTLGVEGNGEAFIPIIKRNTGLPTKKRFFSSTTFDNQSTVKIKVFEGEGEQTKFNHLLCEFKLSGFLPALKGVPRIKITFELDVNSILTIRALDKGTRKSLRVIATRNSSI